MVQSNWGEWPKWDGEWALETPTYKFSRDYSGETTPDKIVLLKDPGLVENYRDLVFNQRVELVFEIGFFQGGMPLFLADMARPEKIVAVDRRHPSESMLNWARTSANGTAVELIGDIDQSDRRAIRGVLDEQFQDRPIDVIIDDASHFYTESKASFEATFSYLKPGGKYVIEDWGWTHWPGEPWQTSKSYFNGLASMSNLIFELVMVCASGQDAISSVNVASGSFVVVTRGHGLAYKQEFGLGDLTNIAGGRSAKLIVEPAES